MCEICSSFLFLIFRASSLLRSVGKRTVLLPYEQVTRVVRYFGRRHVIVETINVVSPSPGKTTVKCRVMSCCSTILLQLTDINGRSLSSASHNTIDVWKRNILCKLPRFFLRGYHACARVCVIWQWWYINYHNLRLKIMTIFRLIFSLSFFSLASPSSHLYYSRQNYKNMVRV